MNRSSSLPVKSIVFFSALQNFHCIHVLHRRETIASRMMRAIDNWVCNRRLRSFKKDHKALNDQSVPESLLTVMSRASAARTCNEDDVKSMLLSRCERQTCNVYFLRDVYFSPALDPQGPSEL
jgi:hypothetical protein